MSELTRKKNTTLWIVAGLAALAFLGAGLPKLAGFQEFVNNFQRWGYPGWFVYLVGAVEVAGAILLLVPRTVTLASLLLGGDMLGALFTHVKAGEWPALAGPVVLLVLLAVAGWGRREELFLLPRSQ